MVMFTFAQKRKKEKYQKHGMPKNIIQEKSLNTQEVKYAKEIWTMIGPIRKKVLFKCQFYHCNKNLQISKPNKEIPIDSQRGQNISSVFILLFHILNISNMYWMLRKNQCTNGPQVQPILDRLVVRLGPGPKIRPLMDGPATRKTQVS